MRYGFGKGVGSMCDVGRLRGYILGGESRTKRGGVEYVCDIGIYRNVRQCIGYNMWR